MLNQFLKNLDIPFNKNVLAGTDNAEDAGIYKLNDNLALVQSVDYFTPVVDDPFLFGKITACNSLSDIYAIGGTPITALNILEFPVKEIPVEYIEKILSGAIEVLKQADTAIIGGHSIDGKELKYGMAVTGIINPERIFTNDKAELNDVIILTKPIGTGAIATAIKADLASESAKKKAIEQMTTLNRLPAEIVRDFKGVHTMTDITGFGLLGHLIEVVESSRKTAEIFFEKIPFIEESLEYIDMGLIPEGTYNNIDFFSCRINFQGNFKDFVEYLLFDPQTSGGLLIFVAENYADNLLKKLNEQNITANIIGKIIENSNGKVIVK